jgi:hypothetical protein
MEWLFAFIVSNPDTFSIVNDTAKVAMIKYYVFRAVARKPVDLTP